MAGIIDTAKDFFSENIYNKDDGIKAGVIAPLAAVAVGGFASGGSILTMILALLGGLLASPLVGIIGKALGFIKEPPGGNAKARDIAPGAAIEPMKTTEVATGKDKPKLIVPTPGDPIPLPATSINDAFAGRETLQNQMIEVSKLEEGKQPSEIIQQAKAARDQLKKEDEARFQSITNFTAGAQRYIEQYPQLMQQRRELTTQLATLSGLSPEQIEARIPVPPQAPALTKADPKLLATYGAQYNLENSQSPTDNAFAKLDGFSQIAYALNKVEAKIKDAKKAIDHNLLPPTTGEGKDGAIPIGGIIERLSDAPSGREPVSNLAKPDFGSPNGFILSYNLQDNAAAVIIDRLGVIPSQTSNHSTSFLGFGSQQYTAVQDMRRFAEAAIKNIEKSRPGEKESLQEYKDVLTYCSACEERFKLTDEMKKLDKSLDAQKTFVTEDLEKYRKAQDGFIKTTLPQIIAGKPLAPAEPAPAKDEASFKAALTQNTAPLSPLATDGKHYGQNDLGGAATVAKATTPTTAKKPVATNPQGEISTSGLGAGNDLTA